MKNKTIVTLMLASLAMSTHSKADVSDTGTFDGSLLKQMESSTELTIVPPIVDWPPITGPVPVFPPTPIWPPVIGPVPVFPPIPDWPPVTGPIPICPPIPYWPTVVDQVELFPQMTNASPILSGAWHMNELVDVPVLEDYMRSRLCEKAKCLGEDYTS